MMEKREGGSTEGVRNVFWGLHYRERDTVGTQKTSLRNKNKKGTGKRGSGGVSSASHSKGACG